VTKRKFSDAEINVALDVRSQNVTRAATRVGCSTTRVYAAVRRRAEGRRAELEYARFQARKFKLVAEVAVLPIERVEG
jgi:hypothetical protein